MKLENKFAIGCLVQWYEVEIIEEYIESLKQSLKNIENKENVLVDIFFDVSQALEKIDEEQMKMDDIQLRFKKIIEDLQNEKIIVSYNFNEVSEQPFTIADYRRYFNDFYSQFVDVLMWGETDALLPKQTFEVLDLLHTNNVNQKVRKYIAFFGGCKMWDKTWEVLEHPEFTDKPHTDGDFDNWWSLCYTMNLEEMNKFNDKVEELDVRVVNPYKFNGCGLVISSDIIKAGVNIPKSAFFIHEDTAFMHSLMKVFNGSIPQFVIKNVLLVHNRKHPNKRQYVKGETGDTPSQQRESTDWYKKAWKYSHHNVYKMYEQEKIYTWGDVFKDE